MSYNEAKRRYAKIGVDTEKVIRDLGKIAISLEAMQDAGEFTSQLVLQEEYRNYPVSDVWDEFCRRNKVREDESWLKVVQKYEREVLLKRRRVLV